MPVWIIIVLILAVAFGPVLYLLPTRKDRRLAAMRLEARRQGLVVELKSVKKLDAGAEERVSASGARRAPVHASVAYTLTLRRNLEQLAPWRLLKSKQDGWVFDSEMAIPSEPDLLPRLLPPLGGLPHDTVALEFGGRTLACYWLETFPSDGGVIMSLKKALVAIEGQLTDIDAAITRRLLGADS